MFRSSSPRLFAALACCLFALIYRLPLPAQSFYGGVSGTITDVSGAVVPGATVKITNLSTNEVHTVTSSGAGEYRALNLVPSTYKVEVQAANFKRFVQDAVMVQVDNTIRVDAKLAVGGSDEVIEVTTAPPALDTESGTVSTQVEGQVVQQMPLNGRNAMNLVTLVPGVSPGQYTQGSASYNAGNRTTNGAWDAYQIGGGFTNENAEYLDGAPMNVLQGNTIALIPTQDVLQEFKVSTSVPSAEFGRFGGGVVEMITKSGQNGFHGTLYEYFRNTVLNANYFFSKNTGLPKAPFHQNQYGVAVGGPIRRDKAFFFFNWENFALRTASANPTNVPTAAQRAGIFNKKITDPTGKCPITTNASGQYVIPQSCFDATSQVILGYYPLPNLTGNSSYNYTAAPSVGDNTTQYNGRIDYNLSSKQRLFGRYTYWKVNDIGVNEFDNYNGFQTGYAATHNITHAAVVGDTYTINPTTIADLRVAYTRQFFNNPAPGLNQTDLSKYGPAYAALTSQVTYRVPVNLTFTGSDAIFNTNPISLVQLDYYQNYSISGSLTKILRSHALKLGAEGVLRQHSGIGNFRQSSGYSTFNSTTTGDEVASFLLGEFTTDVIQTVQPTTTYNYYYGIYATDSWKVNPSLTVNLGLRYELPGGIAEKKDRDTVLLPNVVDPSTGMKGAVALVNSSLYPDRSIEPIRHNLFSPRVSFAQTMGEKMVVRGGYALSFLPPDIPINLMAFSSPVNAALTTTTNGAVPTYFESNPFPNGILQPVGRNNPTFSKSLLGQSVTGPVPTTNFPYMQQWDVSLGQQWAGGFTTNIIYSGAKGTHLPINVPTNMNQIPTQYVAQLQAIENSGMTPTQVVAAGQALRPFNQFQYYYNAADYSGGSNYNALYLVAQKRFRSAGIFNANYTWSKMITDTDSATSSGGNSSAGGSAVPQDYYNKRSDRSLASFDIAHRLTVNYVLPLPFGKGQRFANFGGVGGALISGWTVNGITTFQDGLPLVMTVNGNYLSRNLGSGTIRPNYIQGCNKKTTGSAFQKFQNKNWFNAACFTYPGDFSFGNEPRVDPSLRSQGLVDFDFSLLKSIPIHDSLNLQFRAEAFNLFNHPYFNLPGTQLSGASYDDIPSSNFPPQPRLIQLSLRLNY